MSDRVFVCIAIFLSAFHCLGDAVTKVQLENPNGWDNAIMVVSLIAFVFWTSLGIAVWKKLGENWSAW